MNLTFEWIQVIRRKKYLDVFDENGDVLLGIKLSFPLYGIKNTDIIVYSTPPTLCGPGDHQVDENLMKESPLWYTDTFASLSSVSGQN